MVGGNYRLILNENIFRTPNDNSEIQAILFPDSDIT